MENPTIANIANLHLVARALNQLIDRHKGLPGIGVYYGHSGFGKTFTTVAVANEANAYYVQMKSVWSKKVFAESICYELGVPFGKTISGSLDNIIEQLAASQRPLIIDEADYAADRKPFIEFIRDIFEGSQSPIVLVGEEMMPKKLQKYERFHGRVMKWVPALPVSFDDAVLLAPIYAPGITVADDLLMKLVELAHGSVRRVSINLVHIAEHANAKGLDIVDLSNYDLQQVYTGEAPRRVK